MIKTNSLKKGLIIVLEKKIFLVLQVDFLKPGKGGAYYRTKLKEIPSNKVVEKTFKSGESMEAPEVKKSSVTFLYKEHKVFFFLDDETYEQYELSEDFIGEDIKKFLKENENLILTEVAGEPIYLEFKKTKITYKVVDAPPALKGDSVSNNYRPVVIETGAKVMVPIFIKENENIVVNVETGEYSSREKE